MAICPSPRIPTPYLEDVVLDGIQKRLDRVVDPVRLRHRLRGLLEAAEVPADTVPGLEGVTAKRIGRLVEALAAGPEGSGASGLRWLGSSASVPPWRPGSPLQGDMTRT